MKELSFFSQLKKLKTDLPGMTHKEKLEHIWTYYKWLIPVFLAVVMLLSITISCVTNLNTVKMMAGISVNVNLSDAGETYLREDYKEHLGLTSKKQKVVMTETYIENLVTASDYMDSYYSLMSLLALCSNKEVDYLILDEEGVRVLMVQGAFRNLTEVYTEEELDALGDVVVYKEDKETKELLPIALNITDTPFIQQNTAANKNVFFSFVANSPRLEETKALYQYLLDWKPAVE